MKIIPLLLPIEIKKREFDGRLLIAFYSVINGIPAIIGDRAGCEREIKRFISCVYLAKSLAFSQEENYKNIKKCKGKIFVLYEEGGFIARQKYKYEEIEFAYPKFMLKYIDKIFTYGISYNEILKESSKQFTNSNTFVSGNTRFDLFKPKYHQLYDAKLTEIKNKYGKYILFNGNFAISNYYLGEKYLIDEIVNNKEITPELKEIYLKEIKDKETLQRFIQMIITIAKNFPQINCIVRPHPGEDLTIYMNKLKEITNIKITNEDTVTPWVIGSELVIHQDCTTAVEAIFANKPVISYLPIGETSDMFWLSVYLSEKAYSEAEVINLVKKYIIDGKKFLLNEEQRKVFNDEVINVTEETAPLIINLAKNAIEEIQSKPNYSKFKKKDNSLKYDIYFIERFLSFIRWYKAKYFVKSGYAIKFGGINKKEIRKKIEILKNIHNIQLQIQIKRMGINTYLIYLKNKADIIK